MKSLRECIAEAEAKKVAIGHFNISDSEQLNAIFSVARKLDVPIIIGVPQVVALVRSLREEYDYPIFLNADHTYSFLRVKEAVDAGFDAVIFDGTKLPFEENIAETKKCVEYARRVNPNILVEGELGYIGTSSKLLDELPEGVEITPEHLTKPEEAKRYVEETGVDMIAPAVGNLHGMLKSGKNPKLDIARIKELRAAAGVPVVLHGGSGISDEDFKAAIVAGIAIIHINAEIRVAYRKGIEEELKTDADEIAPYRFMEKGVENVSEVVESRLKLFNNLS